MIINNAINSPLPTSLVQGGTAADLASSASDGGIFYSTSSEAAILGNTATANQILLSGALGAPSWSTATYPATTNINELLYSPSANVIGGLATAPSACLVTDSTGVPEWQTMSDGQLIIGSTSGTPTPATLTAGTNITITNAPGSITINATAPGAGNWLWIATQTASTSATLNFDAQLSSTYIAYRIVLVNLLPDTTGQQLYLRFGTGSPSPTYVTTGYIWQMCDINNDGSDNAYPGWTGSIFNQVDLTWANNNGVSSSSTFGGICGNVDLFVTSGSTQVANGISHTSYMSSALASNYANTTSAFQLPADNFTSVQLLMSNGNILSGTAYLYGLTT